MKYDKDYYENGPASGKSLYENYRWLPDLTIPMAYELIKILELKENDRVLDFGCAKGYLVKALRLLHIDAYGSDTSSYAIKNAPWEIRKYLYQAIEGFPDCTAIIAKDVLEHLTEGELNEMLLIFRRLSLLLFVIVPLGNGERYMVPSYERDTTHIIREDLGWWTRKLEQFGYVVDARYQWGHIKENYTEFYPQGNGFLLGTAMIK